MSLELNDIEPKLQCRTSKNKSTENKKSLSKKIYLRMRAMPRKYKVK